MANQASLIPLLYLLGLAQGLFLSLALLTSKAGNQKANRYLGILTACFTLAMMDAVIDTQGLRESHTWLRSLIWGKEFWYGPLLYLYAREVCRPDEYTIQGKQWLHFLPGTLHVLISWLILPFSNARQLAILNDEPGLAFPDSLFTLLMHDIETPLAMFHLLTYFIASSILLQKHQHRIADTFSYTDKVSLNWLRTLIAALITLYLLWGLREYFSDWFGDEDAVDQAVDIGIVILLYSIGYMGLRQPLIFAKNNTSDQSGETAPLTQNQEPQPETTTEATVNEPGLSATLSSDEKYQNSPLTPELSQALLTELQQCMQDEALYLDAKLSLPMLAEQLGVSSNYLSQCINEQSGQNFFDFVNRYRIDAAKQELLNTAANKTILDIAMAVGFNSKSAFYNAFKKHTGLTPTEFRKQHG